MAVTPSGADAQVDVHVRADADDAAREIDAAFSRAIQGALESPEVRRSIAQLVNRMTKAFDGVQQSTKDLFREFTRDAERGTRAATRGVRDVRTETSRLAADTRQATAQMRLQGDTARANAAIQVAQINRIRSAERNASAERAAEVRKSQGLEVVAGQRVIAREVAQARQRLEIIRQIGARVRQLERVFSEVFGRGAEIATRAIRGLGRVAENVFSSMGRQMRNVFSRGRGGGGMDNLDDGLRQSLRRREADLRQAMNREEAVLRASATQRQGILNRMQRQQERGLTGLLTGRSNTATALGIGGIAAGGAGLFQFIRSGFERAATEERLDLQFSALLGDADRAGQVLQQLSDYARITSFDFTSVAASTATMTAAFGDVDRAIKINKQLADLVAITGGSNETFSRASLAFQQIATAGGLQGDELRQLAELPGLPFIDVLTDLFFGGDKAAFGKARAGGQLAGIVSSDAFFNEVLPEIFRRMPEAEGFAIEAATTLTGLTQNAMENLAIFGARLIELIEGPIKAAIGVFNDLLQTLGNFASGTNLSEGLTKFRDALGDVIKGFGLLLAGRGVFELIGFIGTAFRALVTPVGLALAAFTALSVIFGRMYRESQPFRDAIGNLLTSIGDLAESVIGLATGVFSKLFSSAGGDGPSAFQRLGDSIAGVVDWVATAITKVSEFIDLVRTALGLSTEGEGRRRGPDEGFSSNNPFAAIPGVGGPDFADPFSFLFGEGARDDILIPISELPAEAQAVFAEEFAGVEWVSPQDAAQIWEQFSPDAEMLSEAVSPTQRVVNVAKVAIMKRLASLFGLDDTEWNRAMFGGGNRILNILEETWLGPVVRFFRGPFVDGIRAAFGFVTDTIIPGIASVFAGIGNFATGLIDAIRGDETSGLMGESLGERLYDFFFRDSAVADIATKAKDLYFGVVNYFRPAWEAVGRALSSAWNTIEPIVQPLIDGVRQVIEMITNLDFSKLNLRNVGLAAGAGGILGFLMGGPIGALLGAGAGALTQTPVFDGLIDSIGNLWGRISPLLESLWANITGWFAEQFDSESLKGYALGFLGFVNEAGRIIGTIVSSPEFVGAVAAVAAGALTIVLAFGLGLVQGFWANVDNWAQLIGDVLNAAWGKVGDLLDFLPDPIIDALTAMFDGISGNAVITTAIAGIGILMGARILAGIGTGLKGTSALKAGSFSLTGALTGLAGGLVTTLSKTFSALVNGAGGLVGMMFGRGEKQINKYGVGGPDSIIRSRGQAIGASFMAALGAGALGYAAGSQGGTGSVILALLGGAGAGAALGFTLGGPIGAAIGGGLGAAVAGIGAIIGASGAAAKKAADEVREYGDALAGLRDAADIAFAGGQVVIQNLGEEAPEIQDFFLAAQFNAAEFFSNIAAGTASTSDEFAGLFEGLANNTDLRDIQEAFNIFRQSVDVGDVQLELEKFREGFGTIGQIVREEGIDSIDQLYTRLDELVAANQGTQFGGQLIEARAALEALEASGVDLGDVLDFIGDEGREGMEGLKDAVNQVKFSDLATTAGDARREISSIGAAIDEMQKIGLAGDAGFAATSILQFEGVADAATQLADAFRSGETVRNINAVFGISNLTTEERFEALSEAAKTLADEVQGARDELAGLARDLILGDRSPEDIRRDFRLNLPETQEEIAAAVGTTDADGNLIIPAVIDVTTDEMDSILEGFRNDVADAFSEAISSGDITTQAEATAFLEQLRSDIEGADLSPAVRDALLGELDGLDLSALQFTGIEELAERAAAAGAQVQAAFVRNNPQQFSFNQASVLEDTRFGAGRSGNSGVSNPIQDEMNGWASSITLPPELDQIGPDMLTAIASPMKGDTKVSTEITRNLGDAARAANTAALGFVGPGLQMTTALSTGVGAGAGSVAGAVGRAASGAVVAARVASIAFYAAGANLTQAMASGIRSQAAVAANAAAAVAAAVAAAARGALRIASPSKVFVDIGKQVGQGFVEGIKDSETSMSEAISSALSDAIDKAVEKVGKSVALAKAGEEIFNALTPSRLPGGTSTADTTASYLAQRLTGFQRPAELRDAFADALGNAGSGSLLEAATGVSQSTLNLGQHFAAMRDEVKAAADANRALYEYDQRLKNLNVSRTRGTLGQTVYNQQLRELKEELALGSITQKKYTQDLKELNAALKSGKLNTDEFNKKLKELGSRPDALSFRQLEIRRNPGGAASLNPSTFLGAENIAAIQDGLEAIRSWGQEAAAAGTPLASVISSMNTYIANLRKQAVANGIAGAGFDGIVAQLGLTAAKLNALKTGLTSLNVATEQGSLNSQKFIAELQSIREYGAAIVGAGVSADTAVQQMKSFRNQFLQQATAMGFNGAELAKLVEQVGLSDSALAEFIRQMRAFEEEAKKAGQAVDDVNADMLRRPTIEHLNLTLPFGDPEAVGLSVLNAVAFARL